MSFRIEEKILVEKNQTIDFKKIYHKMSLKKLYASRIIKSLYFENANNEMYKDSIEGCLPRKKIRVRNYPNSETRAEFFTDMLGASLTQTLNSKFTTNIWTIFTKKN